MGKRTLRIGGWKAVEHPIQKIRAHAYQTSGDRTNIQLDFTTDRRDRNVSVILFGQEEVGELVEQIIRVIPPTHLGTNEPLMRLVREMARIDRNIRDKGGDP